MSERPEWLVLHDAILRERALHAAAVAGELARNLRYAVEHDQLRAHGVLDPLRVALPALERIREDIARQLRLEE